MYQQCCGTVSPHYRLNFVSCISASQVNYNTPVLFFLEVVHVSLLDTNTTVPPLKHCLTQHRSCWPITLLTQNRRQPARISSTTEPPTHYHRLSGARQSILLKYYEQVPSLKAFQRTTLTDTWRSGRLQEPILAVFSTNTFNICSCESKQVFRNSAFHLQQELHTWELAPWQHIQLLENSSQSPTKTRQTTLPFGQNFSQLCPHTNKPRQKLYYTEKQEFQLGGKKDNNRKVVLVF